MMAVAVLWMFGYLLKIITGFISDKYQYDTACNTTQVSLIVHSINRTDDGDFCSISVLGGGGGSPALFYFIHVIVPVEAVEIINVSKLFMAVAENHLTTLECKSFPARPVATVQWTFGETRLSSSNASTVGEDLTVVKSILSLFPNKTMNGKNLTCSANNYLDIFHYDWVTLNVTYPPDRPVTIEGLQNGDTVSIIENKRVSLNCTIGESNPPANLKWSCYDVTVFNVSERNYTAKHLQIQASRNQNPVCSCTSTYLSDNPEEAEVSFRVLYPATIINVLSNGINISEQQLDVIENETVHVTCATEGNPKPDIVWSLPDKHYIKSTDLTLPNISRNDTSTKYSCIATNLMNDSSVSEYTSDTKDPPRIIDLLNISIIEGYSISVVCEITPGAPNIPVYISWNNKSGNDSVLLINKINRTDIMWHTCEVNYTIVPSFGGKRSGIDTQRFFFDVLYKAELANFFVGQNNQHQNVTVNEQDSLRMMCILDSNPNSTMQISVRNSIVASEKLTKTLEHYISRTTCNDAGVYTCYGYNFLNTIHSSRELRIFVNCSPRQSSTTDVQQNLTKSQDGTATFSFTTLAYPPPSFKWLFRPAYSELIEAINGQNNTLMISENEMQINFTVTNVNTSDYGEYVLTINNPFGSYQQSFFLLQKDSTYDIQNSPPGGGNAGLVAWRVISAILGIGAIVTAVFLVRKRLHAKQLNAADNSCDLNLSQVCQYESKENDRTVTADGDTAHVYEKLQNAGSDRHYQQLTSIASKEKKDGECMETKDGGKSNVYEKLHATGSDQHYQQLKTVDLMIDKGQHIVYENLRIQRDIVKKNAEDGIQKKLNCS